MAGVVVGGGQTSTTLSLLPSGGPDPNPDNGPGVGGGFSGGGSGNTISETLSSPTPTPTNPNILPPASTSSLLAKPTVIVFNDAANFGTDPENRGRVFLADTRTKLFSWKIGNSTTTPLNIFWYGMTDATGEPFDLDQAEIIARAKFGDSRPANEFVNCMLPHLRLYHIAVLCFHYQHDDKANKESQ